MRWVQRTGSDLDIEADRQPGVAKLHVDELDREACGPGCPHDRHDASYRTEIDTEDLGKLTHEGHPLEVRIDRRARERVPLEAPHADRPTRSAGEPEQSQEARQRPEDEPDEGSQADRQPVTADQETDRHHDDSDEGERGHLDPDATVPVHSARTLRARPHHSAQRGSGREPAAEGPDREGAGGARVEHADDR